jgi:hypothetical protein
MADEPAAENLASPQQQPSFRKRSLRTALANITPKRSISREGSVSPRSPEDDVVYLASMAAVVNPADSPLLSGELWADPELRTPAADVRAARAAYSGVSIAGLRGIAAERGIRRAPNSVF